MKISITSRRWFISSSSSFFIFARWFIFACQPYVLLPGAGELLVNLQRNATINPCRLGERRVVAWASWAEREVCARVQSYKLAHTDINYATDSIQYPCDLCLCVYQYPINIETFLLPFLILHTYTVFQSKIIRKRNMNFRMIFDVRLAGIRVNHPFFSNKEITFFGKIFKLFRDRSGGNLKMNANLTSC
jgi:hypothetical protein